MSGNLKMKESRHLWIKKHRTLLQIARKISKTRNRISASFIGNCHRIRNFLIAKKLLHSKHHANQIDATARIHPMAIIAPRGVIIRSNCEIGPHAVILEDSIIEDNAYIGPGNVIGSQGYNVVKHGRRITPMIGVGGVIIHRNARIQSNSCIDRALKKGFTEIKYGANIESAIHVAHDATIGARCVIRSGSMIGGYAFIGDETVVGLNSSISNRISVGMRVKIRDGAVVTKNIEGGKIVSGNFAIDSERHRVAAISIIG